MTDSINIKKLATDKLTVGMFVHDFNNDWQDPDDNDNHALFANPRKLNSDQEITAIINQGIKEVYIDTTKGKDADGPTQAEIEARLQAQMMALEDDDSKEVIVQIPLRQE